MVFSCEARYCGAGTVGSVVILAPISSSVCVYDGVRFVKMGEQDKTPAPQPMITVIVITVSRLPFKTQTCKQHAVPQLHYQKKKKLQSRKSGKCTAEECCVQGILLVN